MLNHLFQNINQILQTGEKKKFYLLVILNLIVSVLDIAFLASLLFVIAFYTRSGAIRHFRFMPAWLTEQNSFALIIVFLFLFTLKNLLGYLLFHLQYRFVYQVASRISGNSLLNYLEGSYNQYVNTPPATYIRQISDHPIQFGQYILFGCQQIITELALILFSIIGILLLNAKLFVLLLFVLVPPAVLVAYLSRRKLQAARQYAKVSSEQTLQYLNDALAGFVESNIYNKNSFFSDRFLAEQKKFNRYLSDIQITQGLPTRLIEIFAVLGLSVLIITNKGLAGNIGGQIINIGAFMIAAYKLIPGIARMSNISAQIKTHTFTIDNILKDTKPNKKNVIHKKISSVELKNISFAHSGTNQIKDFSLKITGGTFVGLSGASGKGKTTIINLLLGFLSPDNGTIEINSLPVTTEEIEQYRNDISYVKQQPFLIHDTLLKNITLDDNYDMERLDYAVKISGVETLMHDTQLKLNKIITDTGKNISGGQRQRIAIARALYKNADLIILDEPFNELDNESELFLLEQFKKLSQQGKMILLITHNKNSFSYCDKIVTLDEN